MPEILILGGGFAGLWAALTARRTALDQNQNLSIALVSDDDHLTLRPRLFEPDPEGFRIPLIPILEAVNIEFIHARATIIDTQQCLVKLAPDNKTLNYDRLVLATGSILARLPVPGAETAFDLDSWSSAMKFEGHLKNTIASLNNSTIIIVGAGFTGIEIAMNMRARIELVSDAIKAKASRIILLDRSDVVGPELGDNPRPVIETALVEAGIEIQLGVDIAAIDKQGLTLADGERLDANTVVISSGAIANPLTEQIPAPRDDLGRLFVGPDLRVDGLNNIFATGDAAHAIVDEAGHVAMMSCQHALTMGRFAGYNVAQDLLGLPTTPYRQERYTTCLDLGSAGAVFTKGWERVVEKTGLEAKKIKRLINSETIYPPYGDRDQILETATLPSDPQR